MNIRVIFFSILFFSMNEKVCAKEIDFKNWNNYFVNVNSELSSIFLDLTLIDRAPIEKYPKLSWYWIIMKSPKKNGLSSQSEFSDLIKHEDVLLDYLSSQPVKYVGRITTQGRREFYFYSAEGYDFEKAISKFVGDNAVYKFQSGQKNDPNWNQYVDLLYPGENGLKQIRENK